MKNAYVYILASNRKGTLYTGVTSDLIKRAAQHKGKVCDGFTKRYDVVQLVYFEIHEDIREAILREKRIKKWKRAWKIRLIEQTNPHWFDLFYEIGGEDGFPKFTNEVQHLYKVLLWEADITRSPLKSGVRWPDYKERDVQCVKSRQLWIARHRALLAR